MKYLLPFSFLFVPACASKDVALQPAVIEKAGCTMNFADFKAPLDVNSKNFRSAEIQQRDEVAKMVSQKAVLKSGVEVAFAGGGCAHVAYSFTYSKVKEKHTQIAATVQRTLKLLNQTAVTDDKKTPLIEALQKALKVNAKEIVERQFELDCKPANCNLDAREEGQIKIDYQLAL